MRNGIVAWYSLANITFDTFDFAENLGEKRIILFKLRKKQIKFITQTQEVIFLYFALPFSSIPDILYLNTLIPIARFTHNRPHVLPEGEKGIIKHNYEDIVG